MLRLRLFIFLALLASWNTGRAHDPGLSSARLVLFADHIELVTTFSTLDAQWFLPHPNLEKSAQTPVAFEPSALRDLSATLWTLQQGEQVLLADFTSVVPAAGDNIICTQIFPLPPPGGVLRFNSQVFMFLPPGHRQDLTVLSPTGAVVLNKLLSQPDARLELTLPSPSSSALAAAPTIPAGSVGPSVRFLEFFHLGIEHILTGYDHLLFLFAFLLTARGARSVLKTVTSFTIAHSLTLALSAFHVISLPSQWVEATIAATILFVALQNVLRRERSGDRVGLTFAFGLIHGFGFASVLHHLGISSLGTSAWRALAGFNLGVEVGQIALAALIFPILCGMRSRTRLDRALTPTASALIALAGAYWLVQRVGWI